jgi:ferrous iron transport protein A
MSPTLLGELNPGARATILSVGKIGNCHADLARRLLEMGLLEGAEVEVLHQAPFGGDPIAVRVRGSLIALRRNEACFIEVEAVRE